ncbi:MAG: EamA family transporter, partial [Actinomycetota bacterium]
AVPSAVLVSIDAGERKVAAATPRERAAAWRRQARTRLLAIVAGIGFGLFFIALSRTSPDAGLHPLLGARVASISGLTIAVAASPSRAGFGARWWPIIILAGILDCAANSFYLGAVQLGSLTWVAAISSLYPVSTVLLARVVLGERMGRLQIGGLATAAGALVLVGIGAT